MSGRRDILHKLSHSYIQAIFCSAADTATLSLEPVDCQQGRISATRSWGSLACASDGMVWRHKECTNWFSRMPWPLLRMAPEGSPYLLGMEPGSWARGVWRSDLCTYLAWTYHITYITKSLPAPSKVESFWWFSYSKASKMAFPSKRSRCRLAVFEEVRHVHGQLQTGTRSGHWQLLGFGFAPFTKDLSKRSRMTTYLNPPVFFWGFEFWDGKSYIKNMKKPTPKAPHPEIMPNKTRFGFWRPRMFYFVRQFPSLWLYKCDFKNGFRSLRRPEVIPSNSKAEPRSCLPWSCIVGHSASCRVQRGPARTETLSGQKKVRRLKVQRKFQEQGCMKWIEVGA